MAVVFRASASATTGVAAAQSLTITKPAATATGDTMKADLAVQGGSNVRVLAPSGWALVRQSNSGTSLSLLTYQRQATDSEGANYTWVFDSARNACGAIRTYRNDTALSFCRVVSESGSDTASGTTHDAPTLTSNVSGQLMVTTFSAFQNDTWSPDAAQTERDDTTTTSGANDVCLETADDALAGTGTTGVRTATLGSGVAAVGCTHSCLISPDGATQALGTGNLITIFDDTKSENATEFSYPELAVSYPNDIISLGSTNIRSTYRSLVSLMVGKSPVGTKTTIAGTNICVIYDEGFTIKMATTTRGSWNTNFGTKVGTSNTSGGKGGCWIATGIAGTWVGNLRLYASALECGQGTGSAFISLAPALAGLTSDVQNCLISVRSKISDATMFFGAAAIPLDNLYNCQMSSSPGNSTGQTIPTLRVTAAERLSVSVTSANISCISGSGANLIAVKNISMAGSSPGTSDVRWISSPASGWKLVSPAWSGNSPKFSAITSNIPTLANATLEYRIFNVKVVNASGAAISSIPVKLTDTTGSAQVDTTTDANGRVSFGSGLTANAVIVMDHYAVGTTYTQRHRSPFLVEINTGNSANSDYRSQRYYMYWPGYESVTVSAGIFEDVNDTIPLQFASGAATTWVEMVQP